MKKALKITFIIIAIIIILSSVYLILRNPIRNWHNKNVEIDYSCVTDDDCDYIKDCSCCGNTCANIESPTRWCEPSFPDRCRYLECVPEPYSECLCVDNKCTEQRVVIQPPN